MKLPKQYSFDHKFTPATDPNFPGLRVGGGITGGGWGWPGLFLKVGYRLPPIPELELGPEVSWFAENWGIRRLSISLDAKYNIDLKAHHLVPAELRIYPIAGVNISQNFGQQRFIPPNFELRNNTTSLGMNLGLGTEYRISEYLTTFIEGKNVFRNQNSNAIIFELGFNMWLNI